MGNYTTELNTHAEKDLKKNMFCPKEQANVTNKADLCLQMLCYKAVVILQ